MILKNSAILAFFAGVSLLLGILRDRLLSTIVGVGPLLDVYNASFRVPDLTLGILLSLASATTVVPFLTHAVHTDDKKSLEERFSSLFIFFGGAMIVLGVIIVAALPFIVHIVVPGFNQDQMSLYVKATRILMIQPLLLGLSTLISSLAQVRHQFIVYSIAPLVYTASIVVSVIEYPKYGFSSLIVGVVVGALFHVAIQSYTLIRQEVTISLRAFNWTLMKSHLLFATPRSGSYMTSRVRDIIFASVATTFGAGALSIYVFAQRVVDAYMQVIVQSISTASLPRLALHHTKGESAASSRLIRKSISYIIFLSLGMTAFIYLFKEPLLMILYGRNAPIAAIGNLLSLFSIGLPMLAINFYFTSAFNASKNNVPIFVSNFTSSVCAVIVLLFLRKAGYGIQSLGYASIVISFVSLLLLTTFYSRKRTTSATL
jgi:putative peptidoglycan lipid II flippase